MDNIDDYIKRLDNILSVPSTSKNNNVPQQERTKQNKTTKKDDDLLFSGNYSTYEQIDSLAKRLFILHTKGIYIPPHECHKKKRKFNSKGKTERANKIFKTTVGTGQIGATCEFYGFKNCDCCVPNGEDYVFDQITNIRPTSNENNPQGQLYVDLTKEIARPPILMDDSVISISDSDVSDDEVAITNPSPTITKIEKLDTGITEHYNSDDSVTNYIDKVTEDYNEDEMRKFEDHLTADILLKDDIPEIKTEKTESDEVIPNYANVENITDYIDLVTSSYDLESIHNDHLEIEDLPNLTTTKENITPYKESQKSQKPQKDNYKENIPPVPDVEDSCPQMICPICLDPLKEKEIMSTICGHLFCTECIKSVIKQTKACPNCRKKLTLKSIHPIYLA